MCEEILNPCGNVEIEINVVLFWTADRMDTVCLAPA